MYPSDFCKVHHNNAYVQNAIQKYKKLYKIKCKCSFKQEKTGQSDGHRV